MKARKFPSCPIPRNVTLSQRLQREVGKNVFLVTTDPSTSHTSGVLTKAGKGSITVDIEKEGTKVLALIPFSKLIQLTGEEVTQIPHHVTAMETLQGHENSNGFVLADKLFLYQIGQDFVEIIANKRVFINRQFIKSMKCK